MVDHFRTLLLNLSYNNDRSEYIPSSFTARRLPAELQAIHDVLFPVGTSRYYRLFLAHNYMKLLEAAGIEEDIKQFDGRITYNVSATSFFKLHRISNPVYVSPESPTSDDKLMKLHVTGKYAHAVNLNNFYETIKITQTGTTNVFRVDSVDAEDNVINTYHTGLTIDFDDQFGATSGTSEVIDIGQTGLSFYFYSESTLGSQTAGKVWKFIAESPISFDINTTYELLKNSEYKIDGMFLQKASIVTDKYDNLWKKHFNKVYKLAGLLMSYVARVDQFYKS